MLNRLLNCGRISKQRINPCDSLVKMSHMYSTPGSQKALLELLTDIQEIGTIAGSSVSASLQIERVFHDNVHDIDVFVSTAADFDELIRMLNDPLSISVFNHEHSNKEYSVMSILHHLSRIPIQIIMRDDETPIDLIKKFDMDYIQCAVHKNSLYTTYEFDDTCCTGLSRCFNVSQIRNFRLSKALDKGISVPLFGKYSSDSLVRMVKIDEEHALKAPKKFMMGYIPEKDRTTEMRPYRSLVVSSWESTRSVYPYTGVETRYGHFKVISAPAGDQEIVYGFQHICIPIEVTHCYADTKRLIIESSSHLIKMGINNNRIKYTGDDVPTPGKYRAVICFCTCMGIKQVRADQLLPMSMNITDPIISDKFQWHCSTVDSNKYDETPKMVRERENPIKGLIKKYEELESHDRVAFRKLNAYKAYLYEVDRSTDERAITCACRQMTIDMAKERGSDLGMLLFAGVPHIKTLDQMVEYIEGFH